MKEMNDYTYILQSQNEISEEIKILNIFMSLPASEYRNRLQEEMVQDVYSQVFFLSSIRHSIL